MLLLHRTRTNRLAERSKDGESFIACERTPFGLHQLRSQSDHLHIGAACKMAVYTTGSTLSRPHLQRESKQAASMSHDETSFMPIAALLTPVALALLDPEVLLLTTGVAAAVGVVLIELGPVILTSPSSPPTRQARAYWFHSARLSKQELTFGYATMPS